MNQLVSVLSSLIIFYRTLHTVDNQILSHIRLFPKDIIDDNPLVITNEDSLSRLDDKNWTSITVKEELFEEIQNELILSDYPHVQFIYIQEGSFEKVSSLTVSNLPELKTLIIGDNSFFITSNLDLSSMIKLMMK